MKIAIFSDCYLDLTGGIVSTINAQKAALENLGHEVEIFSTGFLKTKRELDALARKNIYQVPSCKWFFRGLTPVSRRPGIIEKWLLDEHPELKDFDIFYVHYESGCSIAGLRLAKKLKIPSVQVMHGREDMGESMIIPFGFRTIVAFFLNWFHSWYVPHKVAVARDDYLATTTAKAKMWTLMVNHANYADLVLTPSEHFRKKLLHYGVKRPVKVFPNAFPDSKFPDKPEVKTLGPGEEIRMIWHSRASAEKRIMPFLQALKKLTVDYRLDVYGGGGELGKARRFASRNGMNVIFHGNTDFGKVCEAIKKADLDGLVSYNFDTFGMTLIEAEAYGVPVFFCDPDMREVVPEGSFVLSKNETPAAMAAALEKLANEPGRIREMSEIMIKNRKEILVSRRIIKLIEMFEELKKG